MTPTQDSGRLTLKQKQALAWMEAARDAQPSTSDGEAYDGPTFYDQEVKVAYVNHHTARALERRGLIRWDSDGELTLVSFPAGRNNTER